MWSTGGPAGAAPRGLQEGPAGAYGGGVFNGAYYHLGILWGYLRVVRLARAFLVLVVCLYRSGLEHVYLKLGRACAGCRIAALHVPCVARYSATRRTVHA